MNSIFEIAKSGLFTARQATRMTANNIANADTPGYTRRRPVLSAEVMRKSGYNVGRGVSVKQVQQLRNALTDRQIMDKNNILGGMNEQNRVYKQLESVLSSDSGNGLDTQLSNFFNAFSELSNNPQDLNQRRVLLSKAKTLTGSFHNLADNIETSARQTKKAAQSRVDKVNSLLKNLDQLNSSITRSHANGKPDLTGQDQQIKQLKNLSKLVKINTAYNDNGTVEVRIGGITVLGGDGASTITAETAPGKHVFRLRLDNGKLIKPDGGKLAADRNMIENVIPDLQNHLNKIAKTLVSQVNDVHKTGYGLNDEVQRNFFNASNTSAQNISINKNLLQNPGNIAASSKPGEAGNSEVAVKLSNLQNKKSLNNQTLADNTISMMSKPGNRINELESQIDMQNSSRQLLINQQQSRSGVNIDEELTNLIKYQNAFQASARVVEAGRQMSQTLLSIV
jgi:flagellar hook-associated protein 1 FlgK